MYIMKQSGWLELICGSMFSGKSEEPHPPDQKGDVCEAGSQSV